MFLYSRAFLGYCKEAEMDLLHCEGDNFNISFFLEKEGEEKCIVRTRCSLVSTGELLDCRIKRQ